MNIFKNQINSNLWSYKQAGGRSDWIHHNSLSHDHM